jgi:pimeloyl-ACP methyl ester carboxylesterase
MKKVLLALACLLMFSVYGEVVAKLEVCRFSGSFEPILHSFLGVNIRMLILTPRKECKIGQNNPENQRTLSFATTSGIIQTIERTEMDRKTPNYLFDAEHVRYELYQTKEGKNYNWLFLPGGPGADSSYLRSLVDELELPGNTWLIDLPGNGGNVQSSFSENYDQWIELFSKIIGQFDNPILVGHSFGGMFPLLFPELENYLKGFVILNSAPVLWLEEAINYSKQFDLPDLSRDMQEFTQNPNQDTFNAALEACMPYYFPKVTLEEGRKLFSQTPCRWQPAVWWQRKAIELNFSAKWIPQNIPTLIIEGIAKVTQKESFFRI